MFQKEMVKSSLRQNLGFLIHVVAELCLTPLFQELLAGCRSKRDKVLRLGIRHYILLKLHITIGDCPRAHRRKSGSSNS